jgi:DNA-binding winged helix-turn-helix (wHTH) protein
MFPIKTGIKLRYLSLLALPLLAWALVATQKSGTLPNPDAVNLALRRTGDRLLRQAGNRTSQIPAIRQITPFVWKLELEPTFNYDSLPALLQSSLEQYHIQQPYRVAVRRCLEEVIELGYHRNDVVSGEVPCSGREMPEGCHYIELSFEDPTASGLPLSQYQFMGLLLLLLAAIAGAGWYFGAKNAVKKQEKAIEKAGLSFGNSRLDLAGQVLYCNGTQETLTFREAKLLGLFAQHPNELLERDTILQQVWADEGIMVSRSVDVFVSRLRKKLAADPSVSLVAVHGVGYKMEIKAT